MCCAVKKCEFKEVHFIETTKIMGAKKTFGQSSGKQIRGMKVQ